MKKFKEMLEQHREKGRFHPVKPHNVQSIAAASPRPSSDSASVRLKEDLRKWFSKTDPAGDWKRINSKGEAIGPCAREPGEPKPKCMSRAKRESLSKKERASAVRAKRKHDPNPERKGEPINVSNFGKGKISENMENLEEKNVPTSPEKWAQAKSQAKAKFDVYPSAYANGWAAKKYKEMGGGWKSVSEETGDMHEGAVPANEKIITVKHKTSGKTLRISAAAAPKYRMQGYHYTPVNEAVKDKFDIGEYDQEGDMAKSDLRSIMANAKRVHDMLEDSDNLPEWVQSKITLAEDYMSTVANYMTSEMSEEVEQIDEVSLKTATSAYVKRMGDDGPNEKSSIAKATKTMDYIAKKHGVRGVARATKTADDKYGLNDPVHNPRKAFVKQVMAGVKKEEVEQIDEISQDLAGKYLEKVAHDQTKKDGMKPNMYGRLEPKRQKGVDRALDRLAVKEALDNGGGSPTAAAETLTINGQPKLTKTVGQTKMVPFVHEAKETKPPFDGPYTTTKAVIKDKSGAKHTPMSRARDLARKAMARNMKEQSNVKPNPFTVPEIDIGKAPKKTKATMSESRQLEIVREAMKVAKKKKEVTEAGSDKFFTDPELASQITKS